MTQHVVAFSKLRYVYPDGSVALSDISLRITHGECVAVIGANGAGKSTLLQQLNGRCRRPAAKSGSAIFL